MGIAWKLIKANVGRSKNVFDCEDDTKAGFWYSQSPFQLELNPEIELEFFLLPS